MLTLDAAHPDYEFMSTEEVPTVTAVLTAFLRELTSPLLPADFYHELLSLVTESARRYVVLCFTISCCVAVLSIASAIVVCCCRMHQCCRHASGEGDAYSMCNTPAQNRRSSPTYSWRY